MSPDGGHNGLIILTMTPAQPIPDKETIARLPEFARLGMDRIALVTNGAQALEAAAALRDHPAWGFDTESRPTFVRDEVSDGPHIVQFATTERAWVFQLRDSAAREVAAALLAETGYAKAGFGLNDDMRRIRSKLGVEPTGVLDLNHLFRAQGYRKDMGVKAAVAVLFQQRFIKSKKAATSNWANPQLSEAQLVYAGNDAWAAAVVFQTLKTSTA